MLPRRARIGTAESLLRDPWELPRVLLKAMIRQRRRHRWRETDNLRIDASPLAVSASGTARQKIVHIFVCFFPTAANTPRPSQQNRQPWALESNASRDREKISIHDVSSIFYIYSLFFIYFFFYFRQWQRFGSTVSEASQVRVYGIFTFFSTRWSRVLDLARLGTRFNVETIVSTLCDRSSTDP